MRRGSLEEQADRILRAHGSADLTTGTFPQILEPFKTTFLFKRMRASIRRMSAQAERRVRVRRWPLTGPVPQRAESECESCGGPRHRREVICGGCAQRERLADLQKSMCRVNRMEASQPFAEIADYWFSVLEKMEPDFAPELINSIAQRELELGLPAARWPKSETVGRSP